MGAFADNIMNQGKRKKFVSNFYLKLPTKSFIRIISTRVYVVHTANPPTCVYSNMDGDYSATVLFTIHVQASDIHYWHLTLHLELSFHTSPLVAAQSATRTLPEAHQAPRSENSLGRLKFEAPNSFMSTSCIKCACRKVACMLTQWVEIHFCFYGDSWSVLRTWLPAVLFLFLFFNYFNGRGNFV